MTDSQGSADFFVIFLLTILFAIFMLMTFWRLFKKAGKASWAIFFPIYNILIFLEIIDRPWWWLFFFFIPLINVVFGIITCIDCAKAFGKGDDWEFGILLFFLPLIYFPILAFNNAKYVGRTQNNLE